AELSATAVSEAKLDCAMSLGADYAINHSKEDVPEKVRALTGGYGADIVFGHVGAETWQRSIMALAKGGVLVSLGVTTGEESGVSIGSVCRSELTIAGTYGFT